MIFKKFLLLLTMFFLLFTVLGCNSNSEEDLLSIPYLSETFKNKNVVYSNETNRKISYYPHSVNISTCVKDYMDEHKGEDVYYAIGVYITNFPEDYVTNFLYKGKSYEEYNEELKLVNLYHLEINALYNRFYRVIHDIYGYPTDVNQIEYSKFNDVEYNYDNQVYKVREETIKDFVIDDVFYINLLLDYKNNKIAENYNKASMNISLYNKAHYYAMIQQHLDYFKQQGFPAIAIETTYENMIVIYVKNYEQLENFKPFKDLKYYFSMVGYEVYEQGFNWASFE